MAGHTDGMIEARGCRIRMMRGGSGPPLLVLHGAGGAGVWLPFMDRLAERFELIVPEHPGFGASDTPDWLDTIHDLAYFYLDFLADQGLIGVHLVGLSLGGWIAAEIAVRCTARLATLTLVDAAGIYLPGVPQSDPFLRSEEQRIRDNFVDQAVAEAVIARALAPEMEDVNLKNRTTTARLAWQPRAHDPHLPKWLHRIDVPTLVLWGENDVLFPKDYAAAWQRLIPGAKAVVIPRCGHVPNVEKPTEFVAALSDFIARRGGAGR